MHIEGDTWKIEIDLSEVVGTEYKLVITDEDSVEWEAGENRRFDPQDGAVLELTFCEAKTAAEECETSVEEVESDHSSIKRASDSTCDMGSTGDEVRRVVWFSTTRPCIVVRRFIIFAILESLVAIIPLRCYHFSLNEMLLCSCPAGG